MVLRVLVKPVGLGDALKVGTGVVCRFLRLACRPRADDVIPGFCPILNM